MPERFEIYLVCKRRYINKLPFLFLLTWEADSWIQGTIYYWSWTKKKETEGIEMLFYNLANLSACNKVKAVLPIL